MSDETQNNPEETPQEQPETASSAAKSTTADEPAKEQAAETATVAAETSATQEAMAEDIPSDSSGMPETGTDVEGETAIAKGGRNMRKVLIGRVVSNQMQKTITVAVERQVKHPIYAKFVKKTAKFAAHDESEDANKGDLVRIMATRPLSKSKRWRLVSVLERAK